MGDRLEDLLVLPARLARLLVQVALAAAPSDSSSAFTKRSSDGLLLVAGVELARERDLVQAEAGVAAGALERRERVLAALVLGDRERDALLGRVRAASRCAARSGSARRRAARPATRRGRR